PLFQKRAKFLHAFGVGYSGSYVAGTAVISSDSLVFCLGKLRPIGGENPSAALDIRFRLEQPMNGYTEMAGRRHLNLHEPTTIRTHVVCHRVPARFLDNHREDEMRRKPIPSAVLLDKRSVLLSNP